MKIVKVEYGSNEFKVFANLKWDGGYELSSTESPDAIYYYLSPNREFFRHSEGQAFLLLNEHNEPVGRVYACVDHLIPSSKDQKTGLFGFLLCHADPQSLKILLNTANEWLAQKGCTQMIGPVNLNIYVGYRLQTTGFECPAFLGEPRSAPYMTEYFNQLNIKKLTQWSSWDIPAWRLRLNEIRLKLKSLGKSFQKSHQQYRAIPFDMDRIDQHLYEIYVLFMKTFNKNFLFTEISYPEFKEYFELLSKMLDASSPIIINENNQVIGFAFNYPHPELLNNKKTLILHTMCVDEKYRKSGVVDLITTFISEKIRGRYDKVIGALAKEGRTAYDRAGRPSRSYCVYVINLKQELKEIGS